MPINVLFCVGNDPWGEPQGGQSNFAKQILNCFGDQLAVASTTFENLPLRKWFDRPFNGKRIRFFNMGKIALKGGKKPFIPLRFTVYRLAKLSMPKIYNLGVRNLFIECPEILFATESYKWKSVCYRFAGVNNPIANSRYKFARLFGNLFEKIMFKSFEKIKVNVMLASANHIEIDKMLERSRGTLEKKIIHHFPTRVDTNKFKPISKLAAREMLNIKTNKLTIVTCGRLSWIKGWDLILDAVNILKERRIDFQLIFVGDGEEREKLLSKAKKIGVLESLKITGFIRHSEVPIYLNAADLCVVASYKEGWSLAMLEILACGKPLVSTDVSGAKEMIQQGENGFVVKERNARVFADAIIKTLNLENPEKISMNIAARYSIETLAADLGCIWNPLST